MGTRINTIMQTCFFAISGVLPREEAIAQIKKTSRRPTASAAKRLSSKNFDAVDAALAHLHKVQVPATVTANFEILPAIPAGPPHLFATCSAMIATVAATRFPSAQFPPAAHFPQAPRNGRSATSRSSSRCGTRTSASSAASASWFARTLSFAPRSTPRSRRQVRPQPSRCAKPKWRGMEQRSLHAAGRSGRLHRLRSLRGSLPGKEQERSQAQGDQHGTAGAAARSRARQLGTSSSPCRKSIAASFRTRR